MAPVVSTAGAEEGRGQAVPLGEAVQARHLRSGVWRIILKCPFLSGSFVRRSLVLDEVGRVLSVPFMFSSAPVLVVLWKGYWPTLVGDVGEPGRMYRGRLNGEGPILGGQMRRSLGP